MAGSDKRKQSLYFPEDMLKEIQEEATRQDRSLSWIVQKAWKIARTEIQKYPSINDLPDDEFQVDQDLGNDEGLANKVFLSANADVMKSDVQITNRNIRSFIEDKFTPWLVVEWGSLASTSATVVLS